MGVTREKFKEGENAGTGIKAEAADHALDLTPEERRLITAQRERQQAERREAVERKAKQDAQRVERMRADIVEFQAQRAEKTKAVAAFWNRFEKSFPGEFRAVSEKREKVFEAKNFNFGEGEPDELLAREIVSYDSCWIEYIPCPAYRIIVERHLAYPRGGFRSVDKGYKMGIAGPGIFHDHKTYTRPETIRRIISEGIGRELKKAEREEREKDSRQVIVDMLEARYLAAEVKVETEVYSRYGLHRGGRQVIDLVSVKFGNGLKVWFSYTTKPKKTSPDELDLPPAISIYRLGAGSLKALDVVDALKDLEGIGG